VTLEPIGIFNVFLSWAMEECPFKVNVQLSVVDLPNVCKRKVSQINVLFVLFTKLSHVDGFGVCA
jgi:hypothetical protein